MIDAKYSKYRRLFPRIRVSWTAFHFWEAGQYKQLWTYLAEMAGVYTGAMRTGVDLHTAVENELILKFDEEPVTIYSESQMKLELPIGDEGMMVGQLDKLIIFRNNIGKIIDYKSGKLYPYYGKQIVFYAVLARMVKGIPVDEGYVVPIRWDQDYQTAVANGKPLCVTMSDRKIGEMYEQVKNCLYDISWRLECGEFDDFISSCEPPSSFSSSQTDSPSV